MFTTLTTTSFLGKQLIYLPTCHSTNDYALDIIKNGIPEDGQIIITSVQTSGRGQRGNKWYSEPGKNLTFSIIVDCTFLKPTEIFNLNMAVSLGIVSLSEMLNEKCEMENVKWDIKENNEPDSAVPNSKFSTLNSQLKIKWPNDIYWGDRKLGGILIETVIRGSEAFWAVIGIGINVNQSDFQYLNATSIKNILDSGEVDLQSILQHLITGMETKIMLLKTHPYANLKEEYLSRLYKFREKVFFKSGEEIFEGEIVDVNYEGKLGVKDLAGIRYFGLKEIVFIK